MQVTPYLFFDGRCDEAIAFYKRTLGATVQMLMRFKEAPDQSTIAPASADKVMHACLKIGDSEVMTSDGNNTGHPEFKGVRMSLTVKDEADADRIFNGLCEGGQVQMPLSKTFFAKRFGMITDKFGVGWMIIATA